LKEIAVVVTLHSVTQFLGRLHPAVIHFPIALLAASALFEGIQVWRRRAAPSPATPILVALAALGAVASSVFGLLLKVTEGEEGPAVALHGWVGLGATVMALVAAVLVAAGGSRPWAARCVRGALGAGTALVLGTGYLGGDLVFGPNHLFTVFEPAAQHVVSERAPGERVDFEREIVPLLRDSCLKCHGPTKQKGHFRLDRREDALKGGEDGPAILPGDRSHSPLFKLLLEKDPGTRMPQKAEPLPSEQIELLGRWIDQGASWPDGVMVR
jgi:uncharacterized membrane protein